MSESASYTWRKLGSAKWEDAWAQRLRGVSDRLAITSLAGAKTIRLAVFKLTKAQAERLKVSFGGAIALQEKEHAAGQAVHPPIRIRDRLIVAATSDERDALARTFPERNVVVIPCGMAFGTGDHATTAACLRFLADAGKAMADLPWEILDLGCGSGILAIAGRMLGARHALAGDFDPHAVRTARENVRANAIDGVTIRKMDIRSWQPPQTWQVIAANLYSGLLIESASVIATACAPGGRLIFSGVLRTQQSEVIPALESAGFEMQRIVRNGKWAAGVALRK